MKTVQKYRGIIYKSINNINNPIIKIIRWIPKSKSISIPISLSHRNKSSIRVVSANNNSKCNALKNNNKKRRNKILELKLLILRLIITRIIKYQNNHLSSNRMNHPSSNSNRKTIPNCYNTLKREI